MLPAFANEKAPTINPKCRPGLFKIPAWRARVFSTQVSPVEIARHSRSITGASAGLTARRGPTANLHEFFDEIGANAERTRQAALFQLEKLTKEIEYRAPNYSGQLPKLAEWAKSLRRIAKDLRCDGVTQCEANPAAAPTRGSRRAPNQNPHHKRRSVHRSRRQCCVGQASARADHNNHVIPERDGLFDLTHSSGCRRTGDERSAANRKRSVFWVSSPSPQRHPLLEQYACGGAEAAGINNVALNLRVVGGNGIMAIVDPQMTNWRFCLRRCIWRRRNGRDWIELPCDCGQSGDHRDARRFQESALAAARKLANEMLAEVSAQ